ncbi:MAG: hypothetical protein K0S79_2280 [Nitrospira sp.]|nr:hypothetical protein [Nitrospira sp.]
MCRGWHFSSHFVIALLAGSAAHGGLSLSCASAASTIYYCPDRQGDQLISATPGPGCVPLTETTQERRDESALDKRRRDFHIENLQQDVSAFLTRYRHFLECCRNDLSELSNVEELGDEVNELLISVQGNLSNHALASRAIMLRELIPRVAKARSDLKTLRATLEKISELSATRDQSEFEEAGRQSQRIRELEESIEREIHAPRLPGSAKTGANIGVAPTAGPAIGRSSKTGTDIGGIGSSGQDIGASPRSSREIGHSGPSGFEIGATGRAGQAIGASSLNQETSSDVGSTLQRSTVGSTLSDSTVGSSINSSTIGSDLRDASAGSSPENSSSRSSLNNR